MRYQHKTSIKSSMEMENMSTRQQPDKGADNRRKDTNWYSKQREVVPS